MHKYLVKRIFITMNIITPLIICTIAGFGTLLGSLLVFIPKIDKKSSMSLILGFSGTIMILISILDLLPNSIFTLLRQYSVFKSLIMSILFFLLGYVIITILDKKVQEESSLYKVGILSLIGLMLHNFPEGIATFMTSINDQSLGIKLSIAIMLHNIPEGICICIPIAQSTKSIKKGIGASFLASLAEPLGALLAYIFLYNYINDITIALILIFVAGIMITLSINSIYKEASRLEKGTCFLIGIILAVVFDFICLIFF